jgi:phenylalanyl-tRNA synthetase beta chain
MKFSLSWLKDHLDTDWSADQLAEKLTAIGLEVEDVSNPAAALAPFKIARVLTAEKHPQADKLQVLTVDTGEGEPLQVVCGAPNARAGMVGVFGGPGTYIPGSDFTLGKAKIRGVESNGMMCSARELQLGEDHDGIIELAEDAPVGASFADFAALDDPVFDVSITPNRQDCMGVRGIARDLAAAGAGTLKPLEIEPVAGSGPSAVTVTISDPEGCPAFYGRSIRGVKNGPSPEWMQQRLKSAGQRPISALVDITNYVMLDHGRPGHAYDIAKLKGGLTARAAKDGEEVLALNGKTYQLQSFMTVIADDAGVHDIGGIMGGEHSSVTEDTTDVFLEIAWFTPERIARTGQALALTSDARTRFERGADPAFLDPGLDLVTRLILDICGGEANEAVRVGEPPIEQRVIEFDYARTAALGGVDVPQGEQAAILERLGFDVDGSQFTVPTWRRDVDGPADLVEEVTRITGYDQVASAPLEQRAGVAKPTATRAQMIERKMRRTAAARGLNEAVTWSFIGEEDAERFGGGAFRVANPISEEMKVMRPSLLPSLLAAARRNLDRSAQSVRLFEIGRRYLAEGERPRRQPAGLSRCRSDLAPGPLGGARAWRQDHSRALRGSASRADPRPAVGNGGGGNLSRRHSAAAVERADSAGFRAQRAPALAARLRLRGSGRARGGRPGARHRRGGQGRDQRRAAVRPVRIRRDPVAGNRGHAPAHGQELHRSGDRRHLGADRGRGGEARRPPSRLIRWR